MSKVGRRGTGGPVPVALAVAATLALSGAAGAQDPLGAAAPDGPDRERCVCFGPDEMPRMLGFGDGFRFGEFGARARLGILLGESEEVGGQRGVRVREVVDGGPADRAGLAAGDVVVAIDGRDLGSDPARGVVERMGGLEPGDTVAVRFLRDGSERTARVVTERAGSFAVRVGPEGGRWSLPEDVAVRLRRLPEEAARAVERIEIRRGGPELVAVNEDLGRYFGTDRGVLVAEVDDDSTLGLRAGDVILSIDGREVRTPGHARSILRSYLPDETITLQVVRDRRTTTVQGTRGR